MGGALFFRYIMATSEESVQRQILWMQSGEHMYNWSLLRYNIGTSTVCITVNATHAASARKTLLKANRERKETTNPSCPTAYGTVPVVQEVCMVRYGARSTGGMYGTVRGP